MVRPQNTLLQSLTASAFALLSEELTQVDLAVGAHVQAAEVKTQWVYFPVTSLLLMIALGPSGERIESSMVGAEGAAGLIEACGSGESCGECVVQVDGSAWRASSSVCRAVVMASPSFADAAWRSAEMQLAEARQSGLCHALHPLEQRLARWLLESMDRSGGRNPLPMTQQFMAGMLGVQRTTVTAMAGRIQDLGLIQYNRGQLTIVNPDNLEALACDCRKAMQARKTQLFEDKFLMEMISSTTNFWYKILLSYGGGLA